MTDKSKWKLVPIEPTPEMLSAGAHGSGEDSENVAAGAWEAMIEAAPALDNGKADLADAAQEPPFPDTVTGLVEELRAAILRATADEVNGCPNGDIIVKGCEAAEYCDPEDAAAAFVDCIIDEIKPFLEAKDRELAEALRERDVADDAREAHAKCTTALIDAAEARIAVLEDALRVKDEDNAGLTRVIDKVRHWAESRCPCHNEEPNPCPLCGASVENFESCKSAENTLPRDILEAIRRAPRARTALSNGEPNV